MMIPGKCNTLKWTDTPIRLKQIILEDMDQNRPPGERSTTAAFYSEYIKNKYGVEIGPDALRARLSEYRRNVSYAVSSIPVYTEFLKLEGDWLISGDYHIPAHDPWMIEALIAVAKSYDIKQLLIPGDFLDNTLYSRFLKGQEDLVSEDQWIAAETVLETLLDVFDVVVWGRGNHETRIFRLLNGHMRFERLAKLIESSRGDKLIVTEYPYVHINNKWRVTHPLNYSIIPMRVAKAIAAKYRMSIMVAHGHRFGITFDDSGRDLVIDTGGMFDITKLEYIMFSDTSNPVMNNGFIALKDNFPYLFSPLMTDWRLFGLESRILPWMQALGVGDETHHCVGSGHSNVDGMGDS